MLQNVFHKNYKTLSCNVNLQTSYLCTAFQYFPNHYFILCAKKKIKGDKQGSHSSHFTNEIDI